MIKALILGITGSIGTTALRGINQNKDQVKIVGATTHKRYFESDEFPTIALDGDWDKLKSFIDKTKPDIILNGISGSEGLYASIASIESGKTLALANKESVVMGGKLLFDFAAKNKVDIIPVDSEHSAIDELIITNGLENIDKLVITASGGPFLNKPLSELDDITPEIAAKHPTWNMGAKISIDSSTLANKGLEVIEAHYLFGFDADHIEVVIHPQSIIHSMVRTIGGQVYAQMSPPDMVFPIMRALLRNKFNKAVGKQLDFNDLNLTFRKLDFQRFPFLSDAYECIRKEGAYPIVFNTANELAVQAFTERKIKYTDIQKLVNKVLQHDWSEGPSDLYNIRDIQKKVEEVASDDFN